jgi:hypothetical protein
MTATINAERGEVAITLGGHAYVMLPTRAAANAIESQIGSIYWLSQRMLLGAYFPTFREMAIVVAECIRASGKDRGDDMRSRVSTERVEDLLFEEGLNDDNVVQPFVVLLSNMIGGGGKKKALSPPQSPSELTESTTAAS